MKKSRSDLALNKKTRKTLEWVIPISLIGILYFTGLLPEIQGKLQSLIVKSGLVDQAPQEFKVQGAISQDFTLETVDGENVNFSDLKGKTVFVNLWATWCPPCIAELPDIQDLYEKTKADPGIEFIMLNLDKDREKALKFVDRKGITVPVYFKSSALPPELVVRSIPTTFVISPGGEIIFQHSGIASYNNSSFISLLRSGSKGKNS